ncbi:c-type cytochrome [Hydromonas duriensis]|uniref:Cytochrome c n=1 Tax=Hydromonas duriensis TaxID=1527608 RepID=A0A4V3DK73_9BURK|nr:c-type cytochrome [Hydromonas duriensis]TDR33030.1 cytochrome c [Hydromonas duriensis]
MKLKNITYRMLVASAFAASSIAHAGPTDIAKANKCFTCHTLDKKIIGPSFQDISKKYSNQPGADVKLMDRMRKGAVGVWGSTPMPAYPDLSDADLKAVVNWVLSQ